MDAGDAIAACVVFGGAFWVLSPIAQAIAKRIAGPRRQDEVPPQLDVVQQDLQHLQHQVGEFAERVDFAERLLAQQRETPRVGSGG